MPRPVSPAMKRAVLAVAGALMLFSWPDSRATTAAASQRQGLGSAVPRDPQPRTVRRRTETRARALLDARQRGLDYVPGEVIIKFRDGIASLTRQRALSALRSRPSVNDLEWHGDVALLTDVTEPDAHLLAYQLRQQREVEYAEPNYLIRIKPMRQEVSSSTWPPTPSRQRTPNDPFMDDQWNFSGSNMPRAWDINAGATSDIVVAVVDTGVTTVNQTFNFPNWNGSAIQTNPDAVFDQPGHVGEPADAAERYCLRADRAGSRRSRDARGVDDCRDDERHDAARRASPITRRSCR